MGETMKYFVVLLAVLLVVCQCVTAFADNAGVEDDWSDIDSNERYIRGDANGDGKINTVDYAVIKRAVMGRYELSEAGFIAADVNYDGNVNALDYMIVKRVVLGIAVFPHRHDYEEVVVGNLHVFTCKGCGHQYEEFDGELIG